MFYSSIREIWENLIKTYSMKKDYVACYDIERKIFNSRQGTLFVIEYYGTLNELWIELDQYQRLKMCKADSIILGKDKLPSLSEIFFIVRNEEIRRSVMLDKGNSNTRSTMVTGKGPTKRSTFERKPFTRVVVENTVRHTMNTYDKCYGKVKVLERMGGNKGSTQIWVNQTTSDKENVVEHPSTSQLDQDIQVFSKEEMDRL
ncbi:hypothetical protein CR513_48059, partial [Mucuna pruriens]